MGLSIVVKGADFSALGLGNINLAEMYITNSGITSATHKAAIRAFYASFRQAGFITKFGVARLFYAGTALADSLNLVNPQLSTAAYQATYLNDSPTFHTSAGWSPNAAALHCAVSNFPVNGDINGFHLHAWNTTPEADTTRYLLAANANATGNNFSTTLSRKNQTQTRGQITPYTGISSISAPNGYDPNKTGLLSASRQSGGIYKLYDNAAIINSSVQSNTWSTSGATIMLEGSIDRTVATVYTACTFRFLGYGFSTWTDADETALNAMITAFNAAIA
ncbi:hypothetical protein GCM10028818_59880 [Spirosoma horti]